MTYAWSWYDAVHQVATGKSDLGSPYTYYSWNEKAYPHNSMRMTFVSSHDKNAWDGTEFEQFDEGLEAAVVLSVVGDGMPLIYNGQEAGNTERLPFFDRGPIQWKDHTLGDIYRGLFALKRVNSALWNGAWGAPMIEVVNSSSDGFLSFVRRNERDKVFAVLNFSDEPQTVTFRVTLYYGHCTEYLTNEPVQPSGSSRILLEPWGYRVFVSASE